MDFLRMDKSGLGMHNNFLWCGRLWNNAPQEIKECTTLTQAKKKIKEFSKTLPI